VGVSLGDHRITDLDYADDIALLQRMRQICSSLLIRLCNFGGMLELLINPDKCKVLCVCLAPSNINVSGVELENVSSFCYLGSLITADTVSDKDIL